MSSETTITCLVCGVRLRSVGSHLARAHGMTKRDYCEAFGLPMSHSLASPELRAFYAEDARNKHATGRFNCDPVRAAEAARGAKRGPTAPEHQKWIAEHARNLPRRQLPPGAKRADGRDADRAREAQRRRRAARRAIVVDS